MSISSHAPRLLLAAAFAILITASAALPAPVSYSFVVQSPSGLSTTGASVQADTSGTLIGDWDATTNPTGTRTKPGLFGTFGDTENVAVNSTITLATSGAPQVPLSGSFSLVVDTVTSSVTMSNYSTFMNDVPTGSLATNATVATQSFRTRNPSSTFPGGIPVTIPLGDATVTSLDVLQTEPVVGPLSPAGGVGEFNFIVAMPADVTMGVDLSGSGVLLGPISTLLLMEGSLTLGDDGTATLSSLAPVALTQSSDPALALPPLPFALPTVLPPGGTANVIFNLTLDHVQAAINGSLSTNATGAIVPEPTMTSIAMVAALAIVRRRRRLVAG